MKLMGLIWANLFRKKTRTILTLLSVSVAFLLFVLLQVVSEAFTGGINLVGVDRLVTSPKYSIVDSLPLSQQQQILAVEGVEAVTLQHWFGGIYQDPKNFFPKYPVQPREYFEMFNELIIDPEQLEKFAATRTGAVAEKELADSYGWKIGDIIPIQADIWPKADGSRTWEFELVGTFTAGESRNPHMVFQYEYYTEAVAGFGQDQVGWWTARLSDPDRPLTSTPSSLLFPRFASTTLYLLSCFRGGGSSTQISSVSFFHKLQQSFIHANRINFRI